MNIINRNIFLFIFLQKATYFADQVLHMNPRIEAAGFVTIGKSLFPSV